MRVALILSAMLLFAPAAFAAKPYNVESIMLLQPEYVMRERAGDVKALAMYINGLKDAAGAALSEEKVQKPSGGYIIAAVKPGGKSRIWLDFSPNLSSDVQAKLKATLEAVPPFKAEKGVVVFAISSTLWGGSPIQNFPSPPEWKEAMKGRSDATEISELVQKVWP